MPRYFSSSWFVAFTLLFFISGCTYEVELVSMSAKLPADMQKIPLDVAVANPNTVESTSVELPGGVVFVYPTGKLIDNAARGLFPQLFQSTNFVSGRYIPSGSAALLEGKLRDFQMTSVNTEVFSTQTKCTVDVAMDFSLRGSQGILWQSTLRASKSGLIEMSSYKDDYGRLAAEAINEVHLNAAEEMLLSRQAILAAANRTIPAANPATLSGSETPQVVKSDIDDPPAVIAKPNRNAYAIVIGIESYRQKLPKADFAVQDARLVAEYLTKTMGYPEENVITLSNEHASKGDLEKYLGTWLKNNVEKGGTVFVYYSGHGAPNPNTGDAYLVPYDGDPSFISDTGYPLSRLYESLGTLPAKKIVVALDACFSGAGGRSVLAEGARPIVIQTKAKLSVPANMVVLSASSGEQISSTYKEKGHGLFTYFLLKGIKNEDVVGADGALQIEDLYAYLKPQVERVARKQYNNEQTPQLFVSNK